MKLLKLVSTPLKVSIPSIEDRLHTMRAIFEPFIFKTAHKNISPSWT